MATQIMEFKVNGFGTHGLMMPRRARLISVGTRFRQPYVIVWAVVDREENLVERQLGVWRSEEPLPEDEPHGIYVGTAVPAITQWQESRSRLSYGEWAKQRRREKALE